MMQVRFWGVRGSIAVSGTPYIHTGGNTSCVEVTCEGERLVLDGGTGLRALGDAIGCQPVHVRLLFSHVHWDHIQGVPFFLPAFHPGAHLTLIGAERPSGSLRDALERQMRPPQFPVGLDAFAASLETVHVRPGRTLQAGPFAITPVELDHPGGVLAYRIEAGGRSLVYATDNEHGERLDPRLLDLAAGADLLIHDAQYTDAEYRGAAGPPRTGWGHSTWNQAVACADKAGCGRLALFHHDPGRDDLALAAIESKAQDALAGAFAAREGRVVAL